MKKMRCDLRVQMEGKEELSEKRLADREAVWERLSGKRILVAGAGGREQEMVLRNLAEIGSRRAKGFAAEAGAEKAEPGDYVLLFAKREEANDGIGNNNPALEENREGRAYGEGRQPKSWERISGSWEQTRENWDEMLSLAETMEGLRQAEPEAVLLITGSGVYGKRFGMPHPLKEEELGYVCHTNRQDSAAQCMRTAEHFACRLAKEGLPVKTARMDRLPSGEGLEKFLDRLITVLLEGRSGEIYNLPEPEDSRVPPCSPLRPALIRMDGGKAERLGSGMDTDTLRR